MWLLDQQLREKERLNYKVFEMQCEKEKSPILFSLTSWW